VGGTDLGNGADPVAVAEGITGLVAGTTYYYCVFAENTVGLSIGNVASFRAAWLPAVTTTDASGVAPDSATLNALVDANGSDATAWFRYDTVDPGSCDDTFGTRAPDIGGTTVALDAGQQPVAEPIVGLVAGTTYYFCALAENGDGLEVGQVLSFTAQLQTPTVVTESASGLTPTTATLMGTATPNGSATRGWFRLDTTDPGSCDDTFGSRYPSSGDVDLGAGDIGVPFEATASDLAAKTSYFYCALAANDGGLAVGEVVSFTTPAPPVSPPEEQPTVTVDGCGCGSTGSSLDFTALAALLGLLWLRRRRAKTQQTLANR